MNTYYKNTLLLALFLACFSMFSQTILKNKIEKSFDMTNAGELFIDNKYGDVTINGWNKNTISITIDIKVSNKKAEQAKSLLERIKPNIKTTSDYVNIISEISEKNTSFFSRYFNKVNPFDFDKSDVDINYTIYLPLNAEIDVTNKFGDVILDNWTGKLKANVQHGDLWINESIANANIEMKYGKLKSQSITYGSLNIKNGAINAEDFQNLLLTTNGSAIEIEAIETLELNSSKDEIRIGHIGALDGKLNFTDMQVDTIQSNINLTMKVAEFRVNNIVKPDTDVSINQESSNIHINIKNLSFKFTANLEQGVLRLPKTCENVHTKMIDKGKRIRDVEATYGSYNSGNFTFIGKKGIITLKE
ncbi:MAG: hypothetical protein ABJL44_17180 [Algibacter sp.]